jgi:hypothetical protein
MTEAGRRATDCRSDPDLPFGPFTARMARTHRKVVVMCDLNTRRLRFDVEPRELVRLLRGYSKVKAGPFSWRTPSGKGEIGLYLDVRKSNRDGFECEVNTIRYRKPGGSFLAEEGLHVITLEGSRVRDGETLVLIRCYEPKVRDSIFVHFYVEMDRFRQELAKPPLASVQAAPQPVVVAAQPVEDPTPAIDQEDEEDPVALDDDRLDAVDRKIIEVVQKLEQAGLRATDELVASRLPPNPQTDLSYHRVTVNKRRCKLREKGYNV